MIRHDTAREIIPSVVGIESEGDTMNRRAFIRTLAGGAAVACGLAPLIRSKTDMNSVFVQDIPASDIEWWTYQRPLELDIIRPCPWRLATITRAPNGTIVARWTDGTSLVSIGYANEPETFKRLTAEMIEASRRDSEAISMAYSALPRSRPHGFRVYQVE